MSHYEDEDPHSKSYRSLLLWFANSFNRRPKGRICRQYAVLYSQIAKMSTEEYHPSTSNCMALCITRYIQSTCKYDRETPEFLEDVKRKLFFLHHYNQSVVKWKGKFPYSEQLVRLLVQYIVLEFEVLFCPGNYEKSKEEEVENRIIRTLEVILFDSCKYGILTTKAAIDASSLAALRILAKVKTEHGNENKLYRNITNSLMTKLLKKIGMLQDLEEIAKNNNISTLDTLLRTPKLQQIYKNLTTSDYGSEESNLSDEEPDYNGEYKRSTSPFPYVKNEKLGISRHKEGIKDEIRHKLYRKVFPDIRQRNKQQTSSEPCSNHPSQINFNGQPAILTIEIGDDDDLEEMIYLQPQKPSTSNIERTKRTNLTNGKDVKVKEECKDKTSAIWMKFTSTSNESSTPPVIDLDDDDDDEEVSVLESSISSDLTGAERIQSNCKQIDSKSQGKQTNSIFTLDITSEDELLIEENDVCVIDCDKDEDAILNKYDEESSKPASDLNEVDKRLCSSPSKTIDKGDNVINSQNIVKVFDKNLSKEQKCNLISNSSTDITPDISNLQILETNNENGETISASSEEKAVNAYRTEEDNVGNMLIMEEVNKATSEVGQTNAESINSVNLDVPKEKSITATANVSDLANSNKDLNLSKSVPESYPCALTLRDVGKSIDKAIVVSNEDELHCYTATNSMEKVADTLTGIPGETTMKSLDTTGKELQLLLVSPEDEKRKKSITWVKDKDLQSEKLEKQNLNFEYIKSKRRNSECALLQEVIYSSRRRSKSLSYTSKLFEKVSGGCTLTSTEKIGGQPFVSNNFCNLNVSSKNSTIEIFRANETRKPDCEIQEETARRKKASIQLLKEQESGATNLTNRTPEESLENNQLESLPLQVSQNHEKNTEPLRIINEYDMQVCTFETSEEIIEMEQLTEIATESKQISEFYSERKENAFVMLHVMDNFNVGEEVIIYHSDDKELQNTSIEKTTKQASNEKKDGKESEHFCKDMLYQPFKNDLSIATKFNVGKEVIIDPSDYNSELQDTNTVRASEEIDFKETKEVCKDIVLYQPVQKDLSKIVTNFNAKDTIKEMQDINKEVIFSQFDYNSKLQDTDTVRISGEIGYREIKEVCKDVVLYQPVRKEPSNIVTNFNVMHNIGKEVIDQFDYNNVLHDTDTLHVSRETGYRVIKEVCKDVVLYQPIQKELSKIVTNFNVNDTIKEMQDIWFVQVGKEIAHREIEKESKRICKDLVPCQPIRKGINSIVINFNINEKFTVCQPNNNSLELQCIGIDQVSKNDSHKKGITENKNTCMDVVLYQPIKRSLNNTLAALLNWNNVTTDGDIKGSNVTLLGSNENNDLNKKEQTGAFFDSSIYTTCKSVDEEKNEPQNSEKHLSIDGIMGNEQVTTHNEELLEQVENCDEQIQEDIRRGDLKVISSDNKETIKMKNKDGLSASEKEIYAQSFDDLSEIPEEHDNKYKDLFHSSEYVENEHSSDKTDMKEVEAYNFEEKNIFEKQSMEIETIILSKNDSNVQLNNHDDKEVKSDTEMNDMQVNRIKNKDANPPKVKSKENYQANQINFTDEEEQSTQECCSLDIKQNLISSSENEDAVHIISNTNINLETDKNNRNKDDDKSLKLEEFCDIGNLQREDVKEEITNKYMNTEVIATENQNKFSGDSNLEDSSTAPTFNTELPTVGKSLIESLDDTAIQERTDTKSINNSPNTEKHNKAEISCDDLKKTKTISNFVAEVSQGDVFEDSSQYIQKDEALENKGIQDVATVGTSPASNQIQNEALKEIPNKEGIELNADDERDRGFQKLQETDNENIFLEIETEKLVHLETASEKSALPEGEVDLQTNEGAEETKQEELNVKTTKDLVLVREIKSAEEIPPEFVEFDAVINSEEIICSEDDHSKVEDEIVLENSQLENTSTAESLSHNLSNLNENCQTADAEQNILMPAEKEEFVEHNLLEPSKKVEIKHRHSPVKHSEQEMISNKCSVSCTQKSNNNSEYKPINQNVYPLYSPSKTVSYKAITYKQEYQENEHTEEYKTYGVKKSRVKGLYNFVEPFQHINQDIAARKTGRFDPSFSIQDNSCSNSLDVLAAVASEQRSLEYGHCSPKIHEELPKRISRAPKGKGRKKQMHIFRKTKDIPTKSPKGKLYKDAQNTLKAMRMKSKKMLTEEEMENKRITRSHSKLNEEKIKKKSATSNFHDKQVDLLKTVVIRTGVKSGSYIGKSVQLHEWKIKNFEKETPKRRGRKGSQVEEKRIKKKIRFEENTQLCEENIDSESFRERNSESIFSCKDSVSATKTKIEENKRKKLNDMKIVHTIKETTVTLVEDMLGKNESKNDFTLEDARENDNTKPKNEIKLMDKELNIPPILETKSKENKYKPDDFLTSENLTRVPHNKIFAQKRLAELNVASEESNDSYEGNLFIAEDTAEESCKFENEDDKINTNCVFDENTLEENIQLISTADDEDSVTISIPDTEEGYLGENFHILKQVEEYQISSSEDSEITVKFSKSSLESNNYKNIQLIVDFSPQSHASNIISEQASEEELKTDDTSLLSINESNVVLDEDLNVSKSENDQIPEIESEILLEQSSCSINNNNIPNQTSEKAVDLTNKSTEHGKLSEPHISTPSINNNNAFLEIRSVKVSQSINNLESQEKSTELQKRTIYELSEKVSSGDFVQDDKIVGEVQKDSKQKHNDKHNSNRFIDEQQSGVDGYNSKQHQISTTKKFGEGQSSDNIAIEELGKRNSLENSYNVENIKNEKKNKPVSHPFFIENLLKLNDKTEKKDRSETDDKSVLDLKTEKQSKNIESQQKSVINKLLPNKSIPEKKDQKQISLPIKLRSKSFSKRQLQIEVEKQNEHLNFNENLKDLSGSQEKSGFRTKAALKLYDKILLSPYILLEKIDAKRQLDVIKESMKKVPDSKELGLEHLKHDKENTFKDSDRYETEKSSSAILKFQKEKKDYKDSDNANKEEVLQEKEKSNIKENNIQASVKENFEKIIRHAKRENENTSKITEENSKRRDKYMNDLKHAEEQKSKIKKEDSEKKPKAIKSKTSKSTDKQEGNIFRMELRGRSRSRDLSEKVDEEDKLEKENCIPKNIPKGNARIEEDKKQVEESKLEAKLEEENLQFKSDKKHKSKTEIKLVQTCLDNEVVNNAKVEKSMKENHSEKLQQEKENAKKKNVKINKSISKNEHEESIQPEDCIDKQRRNEQMLCIQENFKVTVKREKHNQEGVISRENKEKKKKTENEKDCTKTKEKHYERDRIMMDDNTKQHSCNCREPSQEKRGKNEKEHTKRKHDKGKCTRNSKESHNNNGCLFFSETEQKVSNKKDTVKKEKNDLPVKEKNTNNFDSRNKKKLVVTEGNDYKEPEDTESLKTKEKYGKYEYERGIPDIKEEGDKTKKESKKEEKVEDAKKSKKDQIKEDTAEAKENKIFASPEITSKHKEENTYFKDLSTENETKKRELSPKLKEYQLPPKDDKSSEKDRRSKTCHLTPVDTENKNDKQLKERNYKDAKQNKSAETNQEQNKNKEITTDKKQKIEAFSKTDISENKVKHLGDKKQYEWKLEKDVKITRKIDKEEFQKPEENNAKLMQSSKPEKEIRHLKTNEPVISKIQLSKDNLNRQHTSHTSKFENNNLQRNSITSEDTDKKQKSELIADNQRNGNHNGHIVSSQTTKVDKEEWLPTDQLPKVRDSKANEEKSENEVSSILDMRISPIEVTRKDYEIVSNLEKPEKVNGNIKENVKVNYRNQSDFKEKELKKATEIFPKIQSQLVERTLNLTKDKSQPQAEESNSITSVHETPTEKHNPVVSNCKVLDTLSAVSPKRRFEEVESKIDGTKKPKLETSDTDTSSSSTKLFWATESMKTIIKNEMDVDKVSWPYSKILRGAIVPKRKRKSLEVIISELKNKLLVKEAIEKQQIQKYGEKSIKPDEKTEIGNCMLKTAENYTTNSDTLTSTDNSLPKFPKNNKLSRRKKPSRHVNLKNNNSNEMSKVVCQIQRESSVSQINVSTSTSETPKYPVEARDLNTANKDCEMLADKMQIETQGLSFNIKTPPVADKVHHFNHVQEEIQTLPIDLKIKSYDKVCGSNQLEKGIKQLQGNVRSSTAANGKEEIFKSHKPNTVKSPVDAGILSSTDKKIMLQYQIQEEIRKSPIKLAAPTMANKETDPQKTLLNAKHTEILHCNQVLESPIENGSPTTVDESAFQSHLQVEPPISVGISTPTDKDEVFQSNSKQERTTIVNKDKKVSQSYVQVETQKSEVNQVQARKNSSVDVRISTATNKDKKAFQINQADAKECTKVLTITGKEVFREPTADNNAVTKTESPQGNTAFETNKQIVTINSNRLENLEESITIDTNEEIIEDSFVQNCEKSQQIQDESLQKHSNEEKTECLVEEEIVTSCSDIKDLSTILATSSADSLNVITSQIPISLITEITTALTTNSIDVINTQTTSMSTNQLTSSNMVLPNTSSSVDFVNTVTSGLGTQTSTTKSSSFDPTEDETPVIEKVKFLGTIHIGSGTSDHNDPLGGPLLSDTSETAPYVPNIKQQRTAEENRELDTSPVGSESMFPFSEEVCIDSVIENNLSQDSNSQLEFTFISNNLCQEPDQSLDSNQMNMTQFITENLKEEQVDSSLFMGVFNTNKYNEPMSVANMNELMDCNSSPDDTSLTLENINNFNSNFNNGNVLNSSPEKRNSQFPFVSTDSDESNVSIANDYAVNSLVMLGAHMPKNQNQSQNFSVANLDLTEIESINFLNAVDPGLLQINDGNPNTELLLNSIHSNGNLSYAPKSTKLDLCSQSGSVETSGTDLWNNSSQTSSKSLSIFKENSNKKVIVEHLEQFPVVSWQNSRDEFFGPVRSRNTDVLSKSPSPPLLNNSNKISEREAQSEGHNLKLFKINLPRTRLERFKSLKLQNPTSPPKTNAATKNFSSNGDAYAVRRHNKTPVSAPKKKNTAIAENKDHPQSTISKSSDLIKNLVSETSSTVNSLNFEVVKATESRETNLNLPKESNSHSVNSKESNNKVASTANIQKKVDVLFEKTSASAAKEITRAEKNESINIPVEKSKHKYPPILQLERETEKNKSHLMDLKHSPPVLPKENITGEDANSLKASQGLPPVLTKDEKKSKLKVTSVASETSQKTINDSDRVKEVNKISTSAEQQNEGDNKINDLQKQQEINKKETQKPAEKSVFQDIKVSSETSKLESKLPLLSNTSTEVQSTDIIGDKYDRVKLRNRPIPLYKQPSSDEEDDVKVTKSRNKSKHSKSSRQRGDSKSRENLRNSRLNIEDVHGKGKGKRRSPLEDEDESFTVRSTSRKKVKKDNYLEKIQEKYRIEMKKSAKDYQLSNSETRDTSKHIESKDLPRHFTDKGVQKHTLKTLNHRENESSQKLVDTTDETNYPDVREPSTQSKRALSSDEDDLESYFSKKKKTEDVLEPRDAVFDRLKQEGDVNKIRSSNRESDKSNPGSSTDREESRERNKRKSEYYVVKKETINDNDKNLTLKLELNIKLEKGDAKLERTSREPSVSRSSSHDRSIRDNGTKRVDVKGNGMLDMEKKREPTASTSSSSTSSTDLSHNGYHPKNPARTDDSQRRSQYSETRTDDSQRRPQYSETRTDDSQRRSQYSDRSRHYYVNQTEYERSRDSRRSSGHSGSRHTMHSSYSSDQKYSRHSSSSSGSMNGNRSSSNRPYERSSRTHQGSSGSHSLSYSSSQSRSDNHHSSSQRSGGSYPKYLSNIRIGNPRLQHSGTDDQWWDSLSPLLSPPKVSFQPSTDHSKGSESKKS